MLGRKELRQPELLVAESLRDLLPDEHVLVRVNRVLDLAWLAGEVADCYCAGNGRPGIDPEVAVRLMLAGLLLGIVHDRRLLREAQVNLAIRWFCGSGLHERLPDPSSLTRIRQRWGAERFRRILARTVEACVAAGIAKVVLDVVVTTCAVHDTMTVDGPALTGRAIQTATMDGAYAITRVFASLERRGIEAIVPAKAERPPTTVIPVRRFKLDAHNRIVRCPRGRVLKAHGKPDRKGFQAYRARPRDCRACPWRAACVGPGMERRAILLHKDHPALLRARRKRLRWGAREHRL